jgi:hypothetical protein
VRRAAPLLAVLASAGLGLGLAACGEEEPAAPKVLPAVQLDVTGPDDAATVDGDAVQVSGTVSPPGAVVTVLGRDVSVSGGAFSTEVALEEGANLIDVAAVAAGRRPATTAVRVVREVPVTVPDVEGDDLESASERLEALGLRVETEKGGGLFDDLLPGDPGVCQTDPGEGERVAPGSTVRVQVAKSC